MRISDWSSDVCSSDLDDAVRCGDLGEHVGIGDVPPLLPERVAQRQADPLAHGARVAVRRGCQRESRQRRAREPLRVEAGEGIGRALRSRSEEHTSELQSLMRISYAVFCLTKKKNNHRHINTYNNQDANKPNNNTI